MIEPDYGRIIEVDDIFEQSRKYDWIVVFTRTRFRQSFYGFHYTCGAYGFYKMFEARFPMIKNEIPRMVVESGQLTGCYEYNHQLLNLLVYSIKRVSYSKQQVSFPDLIRCMQQLKERAKEDSDKSYGVFIPYGTDIEVAMGNFLSMFGEPPDNVSLLSYEPRK